MKLLFDQNLPPRLTSSLADLYSESSHVMALELDQASDREIREFASQNNYTIVTKGGVSQDPPPLPAARVIAGRNTGSA